MSEQDEPLPAYVDAGSLLHREWERALRDGTLLGQECIDCRHVLGTPKSVCPDCSGRSLRTVRLPTTGEVFSETTIEVTPAGLDDGYQVAVVDLGPTRLLARVEDEVAIGDAVAFDGTVEYDDMAGPLFRRPAADG